MSAARFARFGQGAYLATAALAGAIVLWVGVPGNLIGAVALCLSNLASTCAVRLLLKRIKRRELIVPPTITSYGQIR